MLILWAMLFLILSIVLGYMAFGGIAVAITFFSKILFFIALVCFLLFLVLIIVGRMKTRAEGKEK
jgi:uncharacterized membrane protein YtjA (UPF0391 family)